MHGTERTLWGTDILFLHPGWSGGSGGSGASACGKRILKKTVFFHKDLISKSPISLRCYFVSHFLELPSNIGTPRASFRHLDVERATPPLHGVRMPGTSCTALAITWQIMTRRSACGESRNIGRWDAVQPMVGWWWLEPWNFINFHRLGTIIPTDEVIFFRGVETCDCLFHRRDHQTLGFPLPAAFPSVGPGPSKASENSAAGGHQSESATGGPGTNSINIDFMTKKKHGKKHGYPWCGQRYGLLEIVWKSQNCSCAVLVSLRYLTFKIFRAIKTKSFGMVKPETCNMTLGTMLKGKAWKSYV